MTLASDNLWNINHDRQMCILWRGFCKNINKCTQKHPPPDCQGECDDLNTCPNRNKIECKNGSSCIFLQFNSCEYLHAEKWELKANSEIETLQMITFDYGMRISDIEDKLSTLERLTKESTQNIESLETKFYQKIEITELKLSELQNKTFLKLKRVR